MTTRERTLSIALGSLLGVAVLGGAGYFLVLQPIQDKTRQANTLELAIADQKLELAKIAKDRPRLQAAVARSLPSDPEVARLEYMTALSKVLRDARVPATSYVVQAKTPDARPIPEIGPKKPAYQRVAVEVELNKVSYATVLDVLYRYHQLNLLQHITKFNVSNKAAEANTRGVTAPTGRYADKPDLTVRFTTEAAILDGAEPRRSLLPVPVAMGAAGGGAGLQTVAQSPAPARNLTPYQFVPVLATHARDYTGLLAQDVFHGPPPPPPPVEIVRDDPAPPKEDTSAYIRLTSFGRNEDGTGNAVIEDTAIKYDYVIEFTREDGKLKPKVSKFYYAKGVRKRLDEPSEELDISEDTSGTARRFRVVGLDPDGLVLAARMWPEPGKGGKKPMGRTKEPAAAAAVGFAAALAPAETVYLWRHGDPLSKVKGLTRDEGRRAVLRATGEFPDRVPSSRTTTVGTDADHGPPDGDG